MYNFPIILEYMHRKIKCYKKEEVILIIQSKRVWIAEQFVPAQIEIKDNKISDIYEYNTKPVDKDYGTDKILPGFIYIHCHGAYGFDTNDANPEGLRNWV